MEEYKTKKEILEDVVKLVKKQGGRSFDKNRCCVYKDEKGRVCGHSMALTDNVRNKRSGILSGLASDNIKRLGDDIHKPEYRGHEVCFWIEVQWFHDFYEHWTDEDNLSIYGREYFNFIIDEFPNSPYSSLDPRSKNN